MTRRSPARSPARSIAALLVALALVARPAAAQGGAAGVLLEIRPRIGETLRMKMDQRVEMTGTATRREGGDTSMTVSSALFVATRAVVERADASGTTLVAVTDSVRVTSGTTPGAPSQSDVRHALVGRPLRLLVTTDGATSLLDDGRPADDVGDEVRSLLAQAPASLPREPVAVGESWTREMTLPATSGTGGGGGVKAVFRLDSLTRNGDIAWISMKGAIARDSAPGFPDGVRFAMNGTLTGVLVVDRRRGWMTSSRTVLSVRSTMSPPPGVKGEPMRFRMRIEQWMRTADK